MPRSRRTRERLIAALLLCTAIAMPALGADEASLDGAAILDRAFERRYDLDLVQRIEVVVRTRAGTERRRVIEMASKRIKGRLHHLGRFTGPPTLRGTSILLVERPTGADETFVYLPSEHRVRRVTTAQRSDSFMGTDLHYDDFERRRASDFRIRGVSLGALGGDPVYVVDAAPIADGRHERIEFRIARSDYAILDMRSYKRGAVTPDRVVRAPRAHLLKAGDRLIPRLIEVENRARGTLTRVTLEAIRTDPELDDRLFSRTALENGRPIPGL